MNVIEMDPLLIDGNLLKEPNNITFILLRKEMFHHVIFNEKFSVIHIVSHFFSRR